MVSMCAVILGESHICSSHIFLGEPPLANSVQKNFGFLGAPAQNRGQAPVAPRVFFHPLGLCNERIHGEQRNVSVHLPVYLLFISSPPPR